MNVFMHHAVGFNKDDTLFHAFGDPENEVGIEAFVLIEANSFASTLIA